MTTLTASEEHLALARALHDAVHDLAREHPDYTYKAKPGWGCVYNPDENNPLGCIIGAALRRCGYDTTSLDKQDDDGGKFSEYSATASIARLVLGVDRETIDRSFGSVGWYQELIETLDLDWFRKVQLWQDEGKTWGQAVERTFAWEPTVGVAV